MLAQILWFGYTIAEVSCPTKYFAEASSINLSRSITYGFGCVLTSIKFRLAKMNLILSKHFPTSEIPPLTGVVHQKEGDNGYAGDRREN